MTRLMPSRSRGTLKLISSPSFFPVMFRYVNTCALCTGANCSTAFNYKHQLFAWMSLCSVGFSDLYIRLCSMGIFTDMRIL